MRESTTWKEILKLGRNFGVGVLLLHAIGCANLSVEQKLPNISVVDSIPDYRGQMNYISSQLIRSLTITQFAYAKQQGVNVSLYTDKEFYKLLTPEQRAWVDKHNKVDSLDNVQFRDLLQRSFSEQQTGRALPQDPVRE